MLRHLYSTQLKLSVSLPQVAEETGSCAFLFGATPETNDTYETLREMHPRPQITGRLHGHHKDGDEIVGQVNASNADMLFAGPTRPGSDSRCCRALP